MAIKIIVIAAVLLICASPLLNYFFCQWLDVRLEKKAEKRYAEIYDAAVTEHDRCLAWFANRKRRAIAHALLDYNKRAKQVGGAEKLILKQACNRSCKREEELFETASRRLEKNLQAARKKALTAKQEVIDSSRRKRWQERKIQKQERNGVR